MDIRSYLARINYTGTVAPTPEVLVALQSFHLLHVPFENLDIHNQIPIDLTNLYNKIITRNRGGFCYELNGLFYELLDELGFSVKMVSARVFDNEKGFGPEFDHLTIIADFGQDRYLVDVGFGEFSLHPLKITLNHEINDPRGVFCLEPYDEKYKVVKKKNAAGEFIPEYLFTEVERQLSDFYDMCLHHQTSPASHFTKKRICSLPTGEGRISLTGNTLKITEKSFVTERELTTEAEVQQALWEYFKIKC